jgi:histidinol dehydrogenase
LALGGSDRAMLTPLAWAGLDPGARAGALARPPRGRDPAVAARVAEILADVAARGAAAVQDWATRIDGRAPEALDVTPAALDRARAGCDPADLDALAFAAEAVERYHVATRPVDSAVVETAPGVTVRRVWRPLAAVGLYVPGGTAPLFSTLLHLAIPARIAGVAQRVVCTPPAAGGGVHPLMLAAAGLAGVERIWALGGAQAVAAMALGALVPKCDKIAGPGAAWVAEAKRQAAELPGGPAIDMPAGPSELMVVADAAADPALVAADLLSQAEHDADAQVMLVALSAGVAEAVAAEVERQLATLPRADMARAALAQSRAIVVAGRDGALEVVNAYAPEHLSLQVEGAADWVADVRAAGTVFVGPGMAESFGDYCAGPSHVLPTDGAARAWSGVSVATFMTSMAVQQASPEGAALLSGPAARLARAEGLEAHARAADRRSGDGRAADAALAQLRARAEAQRAVAAAAPKARGPRRAELVRDTGETRIACAVDLDRAGPTRIATGVPFYDHMLDQVARHGGFSLLLSAEGDLGVDAHHTVEDSAIALGQALARALGDKAGVARFGFTAPLDEAVAQVVIDLSGRPFAKFTGEFRRPMIGVYPTELTPHVFRSLADGLRATIHVSVTGEDDHHKTEAAFKAFGRALRQAIRVEDAGGGVPSTKGVL